jgi:ArsR family metal-binding transcriptional regulator
MTRALAERAREDQRLDRAVPSAIPHGSTCARCGGLMVSDFCMDLLNGTGELEFAVKRCVQCGEVVDPIIQRNRQLWQESMTVQPMRLSVQSIEFRGQP